MASSMKMGGVEIEWLGHAGFRLKAEGRVVYIDPFKIGEGEKADLILITHDHYDHCDPDSINAVKKEGTVIVAAGPCVSKIPDARAVKPGDSLSAAGTDIRAVHAYNLDKPYHPKGNGVGFLVTIAGKTIYHAGDTDRIPEMSGLGKVDVALLPVGGTYTMDSEEAAGAASDIRPGVAVPMHWGKIVGSEKDARRFRELCRVEARILD